MLPARIYTATTDFHLEFYGSVKCEAAAEGAEVKTFPSITEQQLWNKGSLKAKSSLSYARHCEQKPQNDLSKRKDKNSNWNQY